MRLAILERGHTFGSRRCSFLFKIVPPRVHTDSCASLKLLMYRPDFFGNDMKAITHEAMRGPSAWPVADRELMAAFISHVNASAYCIGAHTAVSARAYHDRSDRVLAEQVQPRRSCENDELIEELGSSGHPLRLLGVLPARRVHAVNADDIRPVLTSVAGRLTRADRRCARRQLRVQYDQHTVDWRHASVGFHVPREPGGTMRSALPAQNLSELDAIAATAQAATLRRARRTRRNRAASRFARRPSRRARGGVPHLRHSTDGLSPDRAGARRPRSSQRMPLARPVRAR